MTYFSAFRQLVILAFVASCVQVGNTLICISRSEDIERDTTRVMRICNSNIKEYYAEHVNDEPKSATYCMGMKVTKDCPRVLIGVLSRTVCSNSFPGLFSCPGNEVEVCFVSVKTTDWVIFQGYQRQFLSDPLKRRHFIAEKLEMVFSCYILLPGTRNHGALVFIDNQT